MIEYVPDGLKIDDEDWTVAANGTASIELTNVVLAPGDSYEVPVTFIFDGTVEAIDNIAEISEMKPVDDNGNVLLSGSGAILADIDSTPDRDNDDALIDDVIDNASSDEDDHDIARLDTRQPVSPVPRSNPNPPLTYDPGQSTPPETPIATTATATRAACPDRH